MSAATRAPSRRTVPAQINDEQRGLPIERVAEIQRTRILTAMIDVAAERGAANVTVAHIVARSGISRRTFYEIFKGCEECLLAAFDDTIEHTSWIVAAAYQSEREWHAQIRAALTALLELFDAQPGVARFLVVDSLGGDAKTLQRRGHVLGRVIVAVDEGHHETKGSYRPSTLTAEGVVGGALSVLHARLLEADRKPLIELVNPLMGLIVLPYLGSEAAGRELKRARPKEQDPTHRPARDPLRSIGTRLTYRTVCVLLSVAVRPGSSNREIALASGIADQGQISKLLGRLERRGLVCNERSASRGSPNAWRLTSSGEQVGRALSTDRIASHEHTGLGVA